MTPYQARRFFSPEFEVNAENSGYYLCCNFFDPRQVNSRGRDPPIRRGSPHWSSDPEGCRSRLSHKFLKMLKRLNNIIYKLTKRITIICMKIKIFVFTKYITIRIRHLLYYV